MNNKDIKPYSAKQEQFGTWLINRIGRWQIRVYEWSGSSWVQLGFDLD